MRKYKIKNWAKFQHYKDRNPPWIKLHVELLASEDWVTLADASKLLMVVCMIIAARENGVIPGNADYIKRVAYLDKRPDLTPLITRGFLEELLADASESKQEQATARPEKEAEQSRAETPVVPKGTSVPKTFEPFWILYPNKVGKDAAIRAWKKREKAGDLPSIEVIAEAIGRYIHSKPTDREWLNPATWINQGRWMDVPATAATIVALKTPPTDAEWCAVVESFQRTGNWPSMGYGSEYGLSGCTIPKHLVEKYNLDGLTPPKDLARSNLTRAG